MDKLQPTTSEKTSKTLAELDKWLATNRPDYYKSLSPGATPTELLELEDKLGVKLPPELKAFLGWKNGQAEQEVRSFIVNYGLMSTRDIKRIVEVNNELLECGDFELVNFWDKLWIPFLQDYAGNYWCVDLKGSFSGEAGQILTFWHDWEARNILFPSFGDFLASTLTIFKTIGHVKFDTLKAQTEFWNLHKELQPGYPKEHQAGFELPNPGTGS